MAIARAGLDTLANLRTAVRKEVNDADSASYRFTNAEVDDAIEAALIALHTKVSVRDPGPSMRHVTMAYTADADSVALPADTLYKPIIGLEDYDTATDPKLIQYVPHTQLEGAGEDRWGNRTLAYTLLASATGEAIALRQRPSTAKTLRITYLDEALLAGADGDNVPISRRWYELISLHAAKQLRSIEGEWTPDQESRYRDGLKDFDSAGRQYQGPRFIPTTRYYS